ncbi:hypothetical protein ACIRBX_26740 [Kitasatospora sp. NPDC096147]|uniref:hypothetical protein n=1 Tax=Kitasatospora sp. NPDC096147 TaxID=3364093 RepID=UPI0037F8D7CA
MLVRWLRVVGDAAIGTAVLVGIEELLAYASYHWVNQVVAGIVGFLLIIAAFPLAGDITWNARHERTATWTLRLLGLVCLFTLSAALWEADTRAMYDRGRSSDAVVTRTWLTTDDRPEHKADVRRDDGSTVKGVDDDAGYETGERVYVTVDPEGVAEPIIGLPEAPDPLPRRIGLGLVAAAALATSVAAIGLREDNRRRRAELRAARAVRAQRDQEAGGS